MEFLAPSDDEEEVVLSDQVAQLALDPIDKDMIPLVMTIDYKVSSFYSQWS